MNGKTVAGLALIVGAVVFLFGGDLGGFFAFLLSAGLLVYGWRKWKRSESSGGRAVGIGALIFGAILLLSWIPFLIGLLIAVVCIYFGWTLIRQDREPSGLEPEPGAEAEAAGQRPRWEDDFESEWKRFLERQKDKN
ncbi:lia operon protein LiaI [Planifilum fimeticola]|jgi:lia operon protein LiaI|uniref:Lia operon protein LiaI n=1 Tax=Planifilum fimeticola TaxID=201975 RepID=A0A2T0LJK8_9BACL|nr:hypothetical protein [Planifilum fimeticola]PRX42696.1 lia operon protein LiaI [Planifilum fimeticola]